MICDAKNRGGGSQAVYAYAREDLDWWEAELGEPLRSGRFGENLTMAGLEVTDALIGEIWRVGDSAVLQVTGPRIPCATFVVWMNRKGWLKEFTRRAHRAPIYAFSLPARCWPATRSSCSRDRVTASRWA